MVTKEREILSLLREMVKKAIEEMMMEEKIEEDSGIQRAYLCSPYLILYDLNEKLFRRKLPGFESAFSEPHHSIAQEVKR